jgi:hypothetical protein
MLSFYDDCHDLIRPLSELHFKGCEARFACAPMLTYFRVRSASVLIEPPFSLLEMEF